MYVLTDERLSISWNTWIADNWSAHAIRPFLKTRHNPQYLKVNHVTERTVDIDSERRVVRNHVQVVFVVSSPSDKGRQRFPNAMQTH